MNRYRPMNRFVTAIVVAVVLVALAGGPAGCGGQSSGRERVRDGR